MEKHKHALKIGIKWQKIANSSIWHRLQWLQCRQHGQSERKDDGKYCPHDAVAELHTRREENLQLWFSVTLLVQPSEQKPVTGETAVAREYKGWMSASVKILTTTLLQRVFVVTRRCHYWCPSCNLYHILPEMIALFFNHKTPSCTCRRNSRFFFKRHLATDALNSPSPAQCLHLELQPEQLGEFERGKTGKGHPLCLQSPACKVLQVCNGHCQRYITPHRNRPSLLLSNGIYLWSKFLHLLACLPFASWCCCSTFYT